jgi:hypothetical protein
LEAKWPLISCAQERTVLGKDRGFTIANAMDTQRNHITINLHTPPIS